MPDICGPVENIIEEITGGSRETENNEPGAH
jgi:hypothetical protein